MSAYDYAGMRCPQGGKAGGDAVIRRVPLHKAVIRKADLRVGPPARDDPVLYLRQRPWQPAVES